MTTTFYVLHGNDDLSIEEALNKLRAEMGTGTEAEMNITEFDGTRASVAEILNAVSSYPFLADKRMAIVTGLLTWITRKGAGQTGKDNVARLKDDLPNLPDYARLVLVERDGMSKNPITKLAASHERGFEREFKVPADTTGWIIHRAKKAYNVTIENRAALALGEVTGDDLRRADNELVKLVSYVEDGQPITEDDVATLTPYVAEANIFKMVDAIADGRARIALDLLHRLLSEKSQSPLGLYAMIVRQFRLLIMTKDLLGRGVQNNGEIAKSIGVPPFVAKNLKGQCNSFDMPDLERIYRALQENDLKMKTGRIQPELALDLFIVSVAR
jgi:DNA polymerase III subunit delta